MSAAWGVLAVAVYMAIAVTVTRAWSRSAERAIARRDRVEQQRAERLAEVNARLGHWQPTDAELADHIAIWSDGFDPQTGLDRLRNEIDKQQREEEQQ